MNRPGGCGPLQPGAPWRVTGTGTSTSVGPRPHPRQGTFRLWDTLEVSLRDRLPPGTSHHRRHGNSTASGKPWCPWWKRRLPQPVQVGRWVCSCVRLGLGGGAARAPTPLTVKDPSGRCGPRGEPARKGCPTGRVNARPSPTGAGPGSESSGAPKTLWSKNVSQSQRTDRYGGTYRRNPKVVSRHWRSRCRASV